MTNWFSKGVEWVGNMIYIKYAYTLGSKVALVLDYVVQ